MNSVIEICLDHERVSRKAAARIINALDRKPDSLVCVATGTSPARTCQLLAQEYLQRPQLFQRLRLVKLDEWGGLSMDDPGSCESQIQSSLVAPLRIAFERYFGFRSDPADPERECARIRNLLAAEGPIDICLLGLGMNGHIAMNEPGSVLQPASHVARLAESTLTHPMLAKSKLRPSYGLSLGMGEILASREILLLVSGAPKRAALQRFLRREITTEFPASFLWMHPNWTLLCDAEAADGLGLKS